jgi:predicted metal-dependent peptidase
MRTINCDICKKAIDTDKEAYYELPEVTYHAPGSQMYRLFHRKAEDVQVTETVESWTSYEDIHFCPECFWSKPIKALREIIMERIEKH